MKTLFCNIKNPSLSKIAFITGHKLGKLFRTSDGLKIKLDDEIMSTQQAADKMLDGVKLITFNGVPCVTQWQK